MRATPAAMAMTIIIASSVSLGSQNHFWNLRESWRHCLRLSSNGIESVIVGAPLTGPRMKPAIVSSGTALLVILAAGGCSTAKRPPAAPQGVIARPPPAAPAIAPISSSRYFAEATAIDLFELRAADVALQRGSGQARAFALESKRQHQAISAQMSFAGRYLDMLPSRELPAEYKQMLATLLSAGDFNAVYLAQQRRIGERALKLHSDYSRAGESPTLRPVAKFAASAVASELRLLAP